MKSVAVLLGGAVVGLSGVAVAGLLKVGYSGVASCLDCTLALAQDLTPVLRSAKETSSGDGQWSVLDFLSRLCFTS